VRARPEAGVVGTRRNGKMEYGIYILDMVMVGHHTHSFLIMLLS
jgi:uncharacterized Ntn-hydrolase superfamily protein